MTATSAPDDGVSAKNAAPAEVRAFADPGFRIDNWTVEPSLNRMSREGRTLALEPKTMAVLVYLAERPGMLVTRRELDEAVWSGMVVGYDALTGAIQKLRKAFDDDPRHPRVIQTLSKKGYRLIAPVERTGAPHPGTSVPEGREEKAAPGRRSGIGVALATLVLTGILFAGAMIWFMPRETTETSAASDGTLTNSIAVLPFENLSGDPSQEYFADGVTDDLTTGLAKHPELLVIARDSAFIYKDPSLSLDEIAQRLAVRYLVHGSVRRSGEQVWINTQLIDTESANLLWAESFESSLDDVFELQASIAREVASSVANVREVAQEEPATAQQTRSWDAYDAFLRGRRQFYLYASRDDNLKARAFFEAALQYDPDYAPAHAMLAWTYAYDAMSGWSEDREASLHRALELANQAISVNDALPIAYFVTGLAYRELGEYIKALVEAEKAIERDPSYANAHLLLATLLVHAGRPEEGLERIRRAMLLNPHHPYNYTLHLGQALYILGRYDEAVAAFEEGLATNPGSQRLHVWMAAAYAQSGDMENARWEAEQIVTMDPDFSLERIEGTFPFKNPEDRDRILQGLRKAGLS